SANGPTPPPADPDTGGLQPPADPVSVPPISRPSRSSRRRSARPAAFLSPAGVPRDLTRPARGRAGEPLHDERTMSPDFSLQHRAPAPARRHDLDWLRVIAIVLLVYFHTGMIFAAEWGWHIKNPETSA